MFTLRRAQGRLAELAPVVRHFVRQHSAAAAWRPGLALIYSELGLKAEARAEFAHLAQHDFADFPQDGLWVTVSPTLPRYACSSRTPPAPPRCTNSYSPMLGAMLSWAGPWPATAPP